VGTSQELTVLLREWCSSYGEGITEKRDLIGNGRHRRSTKLGGKGKNSPPHSAFVVGAWAKNAVTEISRFGWQTMHLSIIES
jgi:hypothetical protein